MIAAGAKRRGSTDGEQAGRGSLVKWVGTSLALCNHGTCRCRCSSSKSFYQPSEREVTSNSFGITHLHHAFLRRSLQDWWSVWKRLAARASRADVGETRVRGDPALHGGMWMQITMVKHRKGSPAPLRCLCIPEPVIRCMHYAECWY